MYLERLAPGDLPPTVNDWGETQSERDRQSAHYALLKSMKQDEGEDEPPAEWGSEAGKGARVRSPQPVSHKEPSHARHESHDSASSYGKVQPRGSSQAGGPHWSTWQPPWKQGGSQALGTPQAGHDFLSPGAARVALPESVVSQYDINLESPTSTNDRSRAPSQASPPKSRSKAGSKGGVPSKSAKSKGAPSEKGTAYPPLPASIQGEGNLWSPMSNHSQLPPNSPPRAYSRAPSVSPSDSQSNAKYRHTAASPKVKQQSVANPSEAQVRAFSPYRNGPTMEDLLHAARPASPTKSAQKAPSAVPSRGPSKAPSAVPSEAATARGPPKAPSAVPSNIAQDIKNGNARAPSPLDDHLEPNEEKIVQDTILSRRTSYAAPSILEPEIVNSHFHDMDLCILLHQMDDFNTHEVVKKALRKAVRQRVKKLGLKYDSEV